MGEEWFLKETGCEDEDWIRLAQERGQKRAPVNTVINILIPYNAGIFLTSLATIRFLGRTVFH
jgi:hypothetical protein